MCRYVSIEDVQKILSKYSCDIRGAENEINSLPTINPESLIEEMIEENARSNFQSQLVDKFLQKLLQKFKS